MPDVFVKRAQKRHAPVKTLRSRKKRFAGVFTGMAALACVIALIVGIPYSRVLPVLPDSPIAAYPGKETESVTSESSSGAPETPDYAEEENPNGLDGYDPTEGLPIYQDIEFLSYYVGNNQFELFFRVPDDFVGAAYLEKGVRFESRLIDDMSGQWETVTDMIPLEDSDPSESADQLIYSGFEDADQVQLPIPVNALSQEREYRFVKYLSIQNSERFVLISYLGLPEDFQ